MDEDTELGERTSCQENVEVALENDKDKDKVDSNSDQGSSESTEEDN